MDGNVIACSFLTERALYLAYMPFIQGGGLFIQWRNKTAKLGDTVELAVSLLSDTIVFKTEGKVIWLSPREDGHGVALLGEAGARLKAQIEKSLGVAGCL
ncbi:MAG: PilZ domain-containing protein [Gammaproteobacteria bacterium]|nr:PilZ domain-containing protein [Gammaproteobacteria bacterium]